MEVFDNMPTSVMVANSGEICIDKPVGTIVAVLFSVQILCPPIGVGQSKLLKAGVDTSNESGIAPLS